MPNPVEPNANETEEPQGNLQALKIKNTKRVFGDRRMHRASMKEHQPRKDTTKIAETMRQETEAEESATAGR